MAIKVSQATIDKIKKMGMTAALKSAPKANAEMTEALRRMYGQRRLDAAKAKVAPKPKTRTGGYTPGSAKSGKATYTTGSGVRNTAKKAAAPVQKTRPALGGFSMVAGAFKKQDTSSPAFKANQAKLKAAYDKAKAAKKSK